MMTSAAVTPRTRHSGVSAHVLVAADQTDDRGDFAESDRARDAACRFLAHAEHQKLLEKVEHIGLLHLKKCKAKAICDAA
jgi:hypothetical protein